jgi:hypothetical protein
MAVGRISGPLLAQNLFRDNIPLAFYNTSSTDNPLLYLDVQTGLVGVGKPNPSYQLDVNGTVNAKAFRSIYTGVGTGQATIGRLFLSSGTISTTLGPLTVQPSGNENINLITPTRAYSTVGSVGTDTGAFTVAGGVGIAENLYIGGITNIISGVPATTSTNGALVVTGGVGISQDLWVGGIIHGTITTSSVAINAESSKFIEINTASQGIYYPMLTGATKGSISPYTNDEFKFYLENGVLSTPLLTVTTPTQSISNTSGAVVVSGGVGIGANLNVGGTVTASGTLTAQGNTQLGSNTATNTLAINAEITSNLIPNATSTYNIGATTSSWAAGFFDNLYATILASQEGAININPASGLLEINAEIKVNGRKPIGTAPITTNVLYVSTDGSDTNDGRAQDASRACRTIGGALRSPYYAPGTSIKVAPGIYRENNPLVLQPYTSIIGSDLRTTSIEPINKTQDLFHLQSGCYLAQMQFLNGRSGLLPGQYANGYNRGAYATAFPPQVGGTKIDVFHSPYVQNCTNQNGPWLNDGTLFVPNQTVQIPLAVGTGTWSANTTTIVVTVSTGTITSGMKINAGQQHPGFFNARTLLLANKPFIQEQVVAYVNQTYPTFEYQQAKCFRDVGIILENVAYDTTFGGNEKSVEAGLSYYDGVTSVIAGQETQTVAAINYIDTLAQYIINNQTAPDLLSGSGKYQQVINTVLIYGSIAGDSITNHLGVITDIINNGPSVAPTIYKSSGPDASFVSAEILLQANRQFIQADVMSWISTTYPTFQYNQDKCYRDVGLIVDAVSQDIIVGGNSKTVEAGLTYWKGGYNQIVGQETTTTQAIAHARDISLKIIANQTVTKQPGFTYNKTKCSRDVGLIVDSLAFDLLYQGTSQSAFAGLQYWNQNGYTGEIPTEITQTIAAITYLKTLMTNVAGGTGGATIEGTVADNFDEIIYILQYGTTAVSDAIVPNGFASTDPLVIATYNSFKNNKVFFQDTIINFITSTYPSLQYNVSTCRRDVGYIVDSIAFDLLHGGNRQSVMSGVYYYNFNGSSTAVPNEIPQVKAAYTHIKNIVGDIITGKQVTTYQSTVTQAFSYSVATANEITTVENCAELIIDIIVSGPSKAPEHVPISLTASNNTYVANAFNLLLVNREFIKAEVVAYIDTLYANNVNQVINTFFSGGDAATLAVARNFDIINTIITQGPNLAPPIYEGGGLFSLTGINGDDIKLAPVVTDAVSLGSNRYQVTLDTATIGFGINSTLYFGETAVFPALDSTVPEQWAQRRVDAKGGMGGSLVDGGVVSSRSPIASFVYDAFTQVAQGGRGIHIINNGYAQLVSVFTIFCSIAVEVDSGGIGSITNSNSNFGDLCLVAKGYGKRDFSGTVYNPKFPDFITNGEYYPTGYFPQRGETLIFVPDTANRPHIALIMEVEPPPTYINAYGYPGFVTAAPNISTLTTGTITIEGIDTTDIAIGQSIYVRDQYGRSYDDNGTSYLATGTIISDIGYQSITLNKGLTSGGGDPTNANYFTLYTCGNAYYTVLSSSLYKNPVPVGISQIPNQNGCATLLDFINTLTQLVISNTTATITYSTLTQTILPTVFGGAGSTSFVNDHINIIKDIGVNGTEVAPTIVKTGTTPSGAGSAITLIKANIEFIAQETIAYVGSVEYDETICSRDTGLIVDAISQDLLFNGTSQSKFAGIQYWYQTGLIGDIPNELTTTTNAIAFVRDLASKLITGSIITEQYQLNTFPAEGYNTSTQATAQLAIDDFNLIIDIITNGTANVTDRIIPNGITAINSTDIQNAFTLLQVNKEFIKQETIAYIEATKTPGFVYNSVTCARDIGFMIDSVSVDVLYGGNRQAIQSGTYYYGYDNTAETIQPEEIPQVNAAYTYIKTVIPYIVKGLPVPTTYQSAVTQDTSIDTGTDTEADIMKACIDLIENIITNGPGVVTSKVAINPVASTDPAVIAAATAMQNNRDFIRAEVIAYINTIFLTGNNRVKCLRDTRLILQQLIYDLENGGNYYSVYSGLSLWSRAGTYHLVQLGENISNPGLMPDGATVNFYQRSYISASGYLFEYVGAGTNYSSLPQVGRADPIQTKEVLQLDGGKVFFTSTDQNGDFRIGPGLVISQATGVLSGRTFTKSLFAEMTPFILAVEGAG